MTNARQAGAPARRVIVLGASNVTRGLRTVCRTASGLWGQPLDLLAAIGHGRSFGMPSSVLGRTLPSIRHCDLWDEWRARESLPTFALITDIGNDILYGASPDQIADWVRECGQRLVERCQRVAVTGLPLASLAALGPRRFQVLRTVLFPRSRLSLRDALRQAAEVNDRVSQLAQSLQLVWTAPDPSWYGFDPIHIRRRHWPAAWREILQQLGETGERSSQAHAAPAWKLRRLRPKHRWLFGREQRRPQPVWHGPDGSRLSLY